MTPAVTSGSCFSRLTLCCTVHTNMSVLSFGQRHCVLPELPNVQSGFLQPVIDSYCVIMLRSIGMTGSCLCGYWVDMITASLAYFIGVVKVSYSFLN